MRCWQQPGRFRSDLYYRISHHSVHIPALREQADLAQLVQTLWTRMGDDRRLRADALMALSSCDWPGNLRQLVACLRTVVALSEPDTAICRSALPGYLRFISPRAAITACHGKIALAARRLGISRCTLYRRLDSDDRIASRVQKSPLR